MGPQNPSRTTRNHTPTFPLNREWGKFFFTLPVKSVPVHVCVSRTFLIRPSSPTVTLPTLSPDDPFRPLRSLLRPVRLTLPGVTPRPLIM